MRVLTIRQPWAWLIISGHKTIENRTWQTDYRGPLYIHAGKRPDDMARESVVNGVPIDPELLKYGVVIGRVELVDIVRRSTSPWFQGPFGWVLSKPRSTKPFPLRGQQGLFQLPAGFRG